MKKNRTINRHRGKGINIVKVARVVKTFISYMKFHPDFERDTRGSSIEKVVKTMVADLLREPKLFKEVEAAVKMLEKANIPAREWKRMVEKK